MEQINADKVDIATAPQEGPRKKAVPTLMEQIAKDTKPGFGSDFKTTNMGLNPKEYDFNLKTGIDNNLLRAQNQGGWESLGIAAANFIPNVVATVAEQVGSFGSLVSEWGENRDYTNALTELAKENKNIFGEIYLEKPNETFSMGDSAWWIKHISGLTESVAAFAAVGAGAGSLFLKAASGLTKLGVAGAYANAGAQVATAATLAYAEGAMSGYGVYESVYETNMRKLQAKGISAENADAQAKEIASEAAATAVQLNTVFGTALNITGIGSIFKKLDDVEAYFVKGAGRKLTGETTEAFGKRLNTLDSSVIGGLGTKAKLALEGGQEGVEEMVNQFSEESGKKVGEAGDIQNFAEQFKNVGDFFDHTMNEEGALNFILGAFGGVAQTVVLENVPLHRENKTDDAGNNIPLMTGGIPVRDKEGNVQYKKKLYTGAYLAKNQRMTYFEKVKDSIVKDVNFIQEKNAEIKKHMEAGETTKAQDAINELMGAHHLNTILSGKAANWTSEYEGYANLDNTKDLGAAAQEEANKVLKAQQELIVAEGVKNPADLSPEALAQYEALEEQRTALGERAKNLAGKTEAMERGFSTSLEDNAYKEKARQAVADIKLYDGWLSEQTKALQNSPEYKDLNIPAMITARRIDNNLRKRLIDSIELDVETLKAKSDGLSTEITTEQFNSTILEYSNRTAKFDTLAQNLRKEVEALADIIAGYNLALTEGKKPELKALQNVLSKYRVDYSEDAPQKSLDKLMTKLQGLRDKHFNSAQAAEQSLADSLQFEAWKEATKGPKTLSAYLTWLRAQVSNNQEIVQTEIALQQLKDVQETSSTELQGILSNVKGFAKKVNNDLEKVKAKMEADVVASNTEFERRANDAIAATTVSAKQREYTVSKYNKQIKTYQAELAALIAQLAPATGSKLRDLKGKFSKTQRRLRSKIHDVEAQIAYLQSEVGRLTDTTTTEEPDDLPPEEIKVAIPAAVVDKITEFVATYPKNERLAVATISKKLDGFLAEAGLSSKMLKSNERSDLLIKLRADRAKQLEEETIETGEEILKRIDEAIEIVPSEHSRRAIRSVLDGILANPSSFSWGALDSMFVRRNTLTSAQAASLLSDISELIKLNLEAEEEIELGAEGGKKPKEPSSPLTPVLGQPDVLIVRPTPRKFVLNLKDEVMYVGKKSLTVAKINTMGLDYKEEFKDGKLVKTSITAVINPNTNKNMLLPGKIKPGTKIRFEVDEDYQGFVNADNVVDLNDGPLQLQDRFSDYVDDKGKILNSYTTTGEVPIKIVDDVTGEVLGYVPRLGWITAKVSTATNYRNIVTPEDFAEVDGKTKEIPEGVKTLKEHEEEIMFIRNKIVSHYNAGAKQVTSKITAITPGALISNLAEDKKGNLVPTEGSATELLPGELKIAIIEDGSAKIGNGEIFEDELTIPQRILKQINNSSQFIIPMPNGEFALHSAKNRNLEPHEINTMLFAIKTYLSKDAKALAQFKDIAGFDISKAAGLRSFINQHYTHTRDMPSSALLLSIDPNAVSEVGFKITNEVSAYPVAQISVGVSYSGVEKIDATLIDGELNADFVNTFTSVMSKLYKNVVYTSSEKGINGINSNKPIQEVVAFDGELLARGKPHKNYNAYVKSFTTVTIDGRNQHENGQHLYAVNPGVQYSMAEVAAAKAGKSLKFTAPAPEELAPDFEEATPEPTETVVSLEEEVDMKDFDGYSVSFENETEEDSTRVTLRLLQDIHTFETPEARRNERTPQEVFDELVMMNVRKIPEGFNPFLKC